MSISSAQLLAHRCCMCLLLSVATITLATPTRTFTSARTDPERDSSHFDSTEGKCQYNLTDSGHLLEANSSIYQHRGFSKCEYIIQAPSSRFILLNFTAIHSQSDMPVEPGVWRQHLQQAALHTTTPVIESTFKTLLRKPQSDEEVRTSTAVQQSHRVSETASTVEDKREDLDSRRHKSLHSNTSLSDRHGDKHRTDPATRKTSLDNSIQEYDLSKEALKTKTSFSGKETSILPGTRKESHVELSAPSDIDTQIESTQNCSLKLIIEEVNSTSGASPQVICWGKTWQHRIPIVFQYSVPIRITYVWDGHSQSGFSLDFSFLRPEEVDCLFRCNNHFCLPRKHICDCYIDCPDSSDEHNSACILNMQQENGEPHIIKVIVIIISVIIGIVIVLALVFMINHIRCRDGARRRGGSLLHPPHSQSSEVCQSTTGSMQESSQHETLLTQHPQHQAVAPALAVASSHCSEHQQLLHHQQYQPELEQQQQCHRHTGRKHSLSQYHHMSQEHQIRSLSSNAEGALPLDSQRINRPLQHHQQLQQKFMYHQQKQPEQHLQQPRQHRQANKYVSPDELYPPNIPLSADGEEGYAMSQRALHCKQQLERNWQVENELFRPPPNKTVYDRDSPPPPYSLNPPGTKSLDSLIPPLGVVCVLRPTRSSLMPQGSQSGVPRSQSLSCHH